MLAESYLERGLDGLARAFDQPEWSWQRFMDGHRGASMTASWFLFADALVEPAAAPALAAHLDREWGDLPLFAPRPPAPGATEELERLLALLPSAMASSGHVGHNVIYPTFALRALRQRPDLVTASRIDGLCTLARAYALQGPTGFPEPPPFAPQAYSRWLLGDYLAMVEATRGHGQGWSGHALTYSQAVADLYELGYTALARIAEAGVRAYVANYLAKPIGQWPATPREDPPPTRADPATAAYWRARPAGTLEATFAHDPKYAYALLKHLRQAGDAGLTERAFASYYLVIN